MIVSSRKRIHRNRNIVILTESLLSGTDWDTILYEIIIFYILLHRSFFIYKIDFFRNYLHSNFKIFGWKIPKINLFCTFKIPVQVHGNNISKNEKSRHEFAFSVTDDRKEAVLSLAPAAIPKVSVEFSSQPNRQTTTIWREYYRFICKYVNLFQGRWLALQSSLIPALTRAYQNIIGQ